MQLEPLDPTLEKHWMCRRSVIYYVGSFNFTCALVYPKTQHIEHVWTVNEGHCVRDAVEGQSSCTVIHIHSYSRGDGDYREKSVCYCARMKKCHCRSNTRTDHYVQSYTHFSVPFCWCSYMTLIFSPHHSTQPPSNSVHTHSLHTAPDTSDQICLDAQDCFLTSIYLVIYTILPKVLGRPLLMNKFD